MALKKENIQISVTLPRDVVTNFLDKEATKELRTRSKQAAKIILDYYKHENKNKKK